LSEEFNTRTLLKENWTNVVFQNWRIDGRDKPLCHLSNFYNHLRKAGQLTPLAHNPASAILQN